MPTSPDDQESVFAQDTGHAEVLDLYTKHTQNVPRVTPAASAITMLQPLPSPRCSIQVRQASAGDVSFIDALQKMHSHMVGFLPLKQIEKRIGDGEVLIAEEAGCAKVRTSTSPDVQSERDAIQVGYIIAKDTYMKRDDVGIVYQLNVMPLRHRHLVGATLVKSAFERAAYGCRLFSCWCAQDIQANWFWESLGFVPLAFRTGSRAQAADTYLLAAARSGA